VQDTQISHLDRRSEDRRLGCAQCLQCHIEKAFIKNDLGEPDYDGHRKQHLAIADAEKILQSYKNEATKKVIGWVVALFLGIMSSGLIIWVKDHLK